MIKIKFSHNYDKFPRDFQLSKLLDVIPVKLEDLSLDFILYDTSFTDKSIAPGFYPLPEKGNYMILVLRAGSGNGRIWTTIRSQKGKGGIDKMTYYRSHLGEICECVVTE